MDLDALMQEGQQALAGADPQQVDAHRGLLSEAMGMLQGQGVNTSALTSGAGAATSDPQQMSHGDLMQTTLALAQQHPEVLQSVAQRFPEAQGLLGSVLGGGAGAAQGGGGGMLGGLLSKFTGG